MDISIVTLDLGHADYLAPPGLHRSGNGLVPHKTASPTDPDFLRQCAWEIGEQHPVSHYGPPANHVGLAMVHPCEGFVHWHIRHDWVEHTARARGDAWNGSRPVLRLYDVSYIHFTGL